MLTSLTEEFTVWSRELIDEVAEQFQIYSGQACDVIEENETLVSWCWEHGITPAKTAKKLLKAQ